MKGLLLKFTWNTPVLYEEKVYRQKGGLTTGSPLGSALAGIFLAKLEWGSLRYSKSTVNFYVNHTDDMFIVCDSARDPKIIPFQFNIASSTNKFTIILENDVSSHSWM